MKTFMKGLAVALYTAIGVYLQGSGLPVNFDGWLVLAVTVIGSTLVYAGQRAAGLFTTSNALTIQLRDFVSAFIVAIGTALSNQAANYVVNGHFSLSTVWVLIATTFTAMLVHKFSITNKSASLSSDSDRVGGGVGTKPTN